MSTGDPGAPLESSGEQIRQREFATVRRGYDPEQVRAYLEAIAGHVEALERALRDARRRVSELEAVPQADPYETVSRRFANVLATADTEADRIVDHARSEAERIRAEAHARADEARLRGSHTLIAAQEASERMMSNLSQRREAMLSQLHEMQSRLLSVASDLEVAIGDEGESSAPASATATAAPAAAQAPSWPPVSARQTGSPTRPAREDPAGQPWDTRGAEHEDEGGLDALFDDADHEIDLPDFGGLDLEVDDGPASGR